MKFVVLAVAVVAFTVACSPDPRPGAQRPRDGGSGGRGGSGGKGGSGVDATGGTGGKGGTGGGPMGGTGGAMGGSGGAMGGSGGTDVPPAGLIEKPTSPVFFDGTTNAVSKMVLGDVAPGYFYVGQAENEPPAPTMMAVELTMADQSALPPGTLFAQKSTSVTVIGNRAIFGMNFRALESPGNTKLRWINSTDYAGITFWAKVSAGDIQVSATPVGAHNLAPTHEFGGSCAAETCPAIREKVITVTPTWTQFKLKWTDFLSTTEVAPLNVADLGRIDLFVFLPPGTTLDFFVTRVKLATQAELN